MGSPAIFLQNPGLPAQPAATANIATLADIPPEIATMPAGTVLPAVILPAETPASLPVMQLTLPDGQMVSVPVRTSHPLNSPTPVNIKILPSDAQKTISVRLLPAMPLAGTEVQETAQTVSVKTNLSPALPQNTLSVKAFVPRIVPEQAAALMKAPEMTNVPENRQLPLLKPNQNMRIELFLQPEATAAKPVPATPEQTASPVFQQPMKSEAPIPKTGGIPMQNQQTVESDSLLQTVAAQKPVAAAETMPTQAPLMTEPSCPPVLQNGNTVLPQAQNAVPTAADISVTPASSDTIKIATDSIFSPAPLTENVSLSASAPVSPQTVPTEQKTTVPVFSNNAVPEKNEAALPVREPSGNIPAASLSAPAEQRNDQTLIRVPLNGFIFSSKESPAPLVVTKAGVLVLEDKIQLPHLMPVKVQITEFFEPPPLIPAETSDKTVFQAFSEALAVLQKSDPPAFEAIKNILPQTGNKLPAQIFSVIHAASQNVPLLAVIGETNVAALQNIGEKGQRLFKEMEKDFATMPKKVSDGRNSWDGWTVPFLSGAIVQPVSLYVQKPAEGRTRSKENKSKQNALRFVLDLDLSQLGKLQMDGLAHRNERRFDLILRHQKELPDSFDNKIRDIFSQTMTALNYTGTVKVDRTDDFVIMKEEFETAEQRGVWA